MLVHFRNGLGELVGIFRVKKGFFIPLYYAHQWIDGIKHSAQHIHTGRKVRLLIEPSYSDVFAEGNFGALAFAAFFTGDDTHEGAFTSAIFGNQADFVPLVNVEAYILEQQLLAVALGDVLEC